MTDPLVVYCHHKWIRWFKDDTDETLGCTYCHSIKFPEEPDMDVIIGYARKPEWVETHQ